MKHTPHNLTSSALLAACAGFLGLASAHAAIEYDQDVTPDVVFGSGNANGSFTVDRNNGIELGLRGKLRHNASGAPENIFNSNGDGTYSFNAGVAPTQTFATAEWTFEWSINTRYSPLNAEPVIYGVRNLSDLRYELALDSDPSLGTSFFVFDPINLPYADHAIGDNDTGNADGTVATDGSNYGDLIEDYNVAQNSWKPHWFIPGFDPTIDATYDISLSAFGFDAVEFGQGQEPEEELLASTKIQIIVGNGGNGGAPVPDSGSAALMLSGALLGLLGVRRFANRSKR